MLGYLVCKLVNVYAICASSILHIIQSFKNVSIAEVWGLCTI